MAPLLKKIKRESQSVAPTRDRRLNREIKARWLQRPARVSSSTIANPDLLRRETESEEKVPRRKE